MREQDISLVANIDHEAFAGERVLPSYSFYRRDLDSPLARYMVASIQNGIEQEKNNQHIANSPWIKKLFNYQNPVSIEPNTSGKEYIIGFISVWLMMRELHLTAIAVRCNYRRYGVGERLLISAIELAQKLNVTMLTLEVRASNKIAQFLYAKYGFQIVGMRHKYYSGNREDAIIMTVYNFNLAPYQTRFQQLKLAYNEKWGQNLILIQ